MRNWLIGFYIVEYEQEGDDRAKYGSNLLIILSEKLKEKGLKSCNEAELRRYRIFYNVYPQFESSLSYFNVGQKRGTVSHELKKSTASWKSN